MKELLRELGQGVIDTCEAMKILEDLAATVANYDVNTANQMSRLAEKLAEIIIASGTAMQPYREQMG